jgi:hypothetical protein
MVSSSAKLADEREILRICCLAWHVLSFEDCIFLERLHEQQARPFPAAAKAKLAEIFQRVTQGSIRS